jgi:glycosyltransferase involved in cell wall biosynthesis
MGPPTDPAEFCQVSVVLPVYNEERHVGPCIRSLLDQVGCAFEILIVDDGSTDGTVDIIHQLSQADRRIQVMRQDHCGAGAARNRAAATARGTILAFCDGDMVFAPNYLAALIAPIERGEVVGTFSKEEYVANWDRLWARCWNLNDGIATNRRHPDFWPDEHEVFRAVRRDAFVRARGFDSHGSGDDRTLAERLGSLAKAAPGAVCYHYNPDTLREAFRAARWYGRGSRVPATWWNIFAHTPVMSVKRAARRAIKHRMLAFVFFKTVVDTGMLAGLIEKRWRAARRGR